MNPHQTPPPEHSGRRREVSPEDIGREVFPQLKNTELVELHFDPDGTLCFYFFKRPNLGYMLKLRAATCDGRIGLNIDLEEAEIVVVNLSEAKP